MTNLTPVQSKTHQLAKHILKGGSIRKGEVCKINHDMLTSYVREWFNMDDRFIYNLCDCFRSEEGEMEVLLMSRMFQQVEDLAVDFITEECHDVEEWECV